jgi:DNA-directed RNA polymerase specialized sigma24 family protein
MEGELMANICGLGVDDELARRMRNWARIGAGERVGVQAMDYSRGDLHRGYREATMPFIAGDAIEVEAALATLTIPVQRAVRRFWEREGQSWREHGDALGCDPKTVRVRVEAGHALLRSELYRRAHLYRELGEANRARALALDKADSLKYDEI